MYQVMISQVTAPRSPHSNTHSCHCGSILLILTMSVAMVLATLVPSKANPTKLKNAAQATAHAGFNTLVATTVAIEVAESCKPLTKLKNRATTIMPMANCRLGVMLFLGLSHLSEQSAKDLCGSASAFRPTLAALARYASIVCFGWSCVTLPQKDH